MFDVLGSLKSVFLRLKTISVDNSIFKLHYRLTTIILAVFSILVTSKQYLGDPIDCTTSSTTIRAELLDQYCWVSSTYSLPKAFDQKVGRFGHVSHPGIATYHEGDQVIYHQYYQWVCFVLFLQSMMFYLPHYLWKIWECGRLKALADDIQGPLTSDETKKGKLAAISAYFSTSLFHHNFYATRYSICEVLNFANVVGQMFLTNRFLGGTFLTYGTEVIEFSESNQLNRTDPMIKVFPRVTKCSFFTYGSSGDMQNHDALCVLPVNIINEKIYIVLWFWFIILAVLSGLAIIYRLIVTFSVRARYLALRSRANSVSRSEIEKIAYNTEFGDWFVLYLLSKNVNSYVFKEVVDVVVKQLDNSDYVPKEKHGLFKKLPL